MNKWDIAALRNKRNKLNDKLGVMEDLIMGYMRSGYAPLDIIFDREDLRVELFELQEEINLKQRYGSENNK